jgi:hypothetical protein
LATTQDIIRRLIVVAEQRGVPELERSLRNIASAEGSVAAANATMAASTDRSERAVLSATRAFEGLERRFVPTAREAYNLERAMKQLQRFGEQTGQWNRVEQVFDAIAASSAQAAGGVDKFSSSIKRMQSAVADMSDPIGGAFTPRGETSSITDRVAHMERMSRAARELRVQLDPVEAAQTRLRERTFELNAMLNSGAISLKEFVGGLKQAEFNATRTAKGIGLTHSQLVNMGYQLNDVASGLLMGQSPFMIMAQQGGQIVQILNGPDGIMAGLRAWGSRAVSFITPFRVAMAGLAAATTLAAAAWNSYDNLLLRSQRTMDGLGRRLQMTREQFVEFATAAARAGGLTTGEAFGIADTLARETRLGTREIDILTRRAKDISATFGIEMDQVGDFIKNAFSDFGSLETVLKRMGTLSSETRFTGRAFDELGQRQKALAIGFKDFERGLIDASKSTGNVKTLTDGLKAAFSALSTELGKILTQLNNLPAAMDRATPALQKAMEGGESVAGYLARRALGPRADSLEGELAAGGSAAGYAVKRAIGSPRASAAAPARSPVQEAPTLMEIDRWTQARDAVLATIEPLRNLDRQFNEGAQARAEFEARASTLREITAKGKTEFLEQAAAMLEGVTSADQLKESFDKLEQLQRSLTDGNKEYMSVEAQAVALERIRVSLEDKSIDSATRLRLEREKGRLEQRGTIQSSTMAEINANKEADAAARARLQTVNEEQHAMRETLAVRAQYGPQLELENSLTQKQLQLRGQDIVLTTGQKEAYRELLRLTQEQSRVRDALNQGYMASIKPIEDLNYVIKAQNQLLQEGKISVEAHGQAILDASIKAEDAKKTWQSGVSSGLLQLQKDFGDTSGMMKGFVTSTGNSMVTTLADITSGTMTASEGFKGLATTVLRAASEMILKMMVLGPLMRMLGGAFGGGAGIGGGGYTDLNSIPDSLISWTGHSGGMVGINGVKRFVHPSYFDGAQRFHRGGIARNEIPAILRANEEVLTPENPRHIMNGGGSGSITVNVEGARGNQEIMDMVAAGVRSGISSYDASLNQGGLARKMSNVRIRGQR